MAIGYLTDYENIRIETKVTKNFKNIDGYIPKNNKCYCYPYNYFMLTNNSGQRVILKPQEFNNPTATEFTVKLYPTLSTAPTLLGVPQNYNGQSEEFDSNISYSNFPELPWNYDTFKNWQALNANQLNVTYAKQAVSFVSGTATALTTGNISGLVSATTSIIDQKAKERDMDNIPLTTKGATTGNALMFSGNAGIFSYQVSCRSEYIQVIDNFFTRYGYNISVVKKPLLHNRKSFDYIETQDINITGDIPQNDLKELCQIFDSGITLWHNPEVFGDFNVDNTPINI